MRKTKKITYSLILFIQLCTICYAQRISQKFTHYGKQDGLNQSSVNFIYQDSKDYVWIANFGGINRFDGYGFTSYVNEFGNDSSISDNSVWTILECKDQTLWFGTKKGLSKFNVQGNNFVNYFIKNNNKSQGNVAIKALFEDQKGRFYAGSEGQGLYTFSKEKEFFSLIEEIPKTAKVSAITEDTSGNLWVGTENLGLFKISSDRTKIVGFKDVKLFKSETIWSLYADKYGDTWIGTDREGLIKYNSKSKAFISYANQNKEFNYNKSKKIKSIVKGDDGFLWIGSATKGLSAYSFKEKRFYNYTNNAYDSNSLYDNDVSSVFYGANGVLYVGFYTKGFDKVIQNPFKVLKNNPKINNTLSNNNVYCMYLDHKDMLWFGTFGGGLNSYDPKTNQFKHFKHSENNASSLSHNWVRFIYEDHNKTMWVGTWGGGLNKFNRETGTFKHYLPKANTTNSINHNIITAIFEDSDNELWIGTYGGGINIYQPETDDFRSIFHDDKNEYSLSDDHITSFYQDEKEIIWVCTYGGGLNAYNKNTEKFKRFLPNPQKKYSLNNYKTLHIYNEPNEDFFWITTLGGGLNKFYYKENKFLNYTEKDGLSNNSTMGMLIDEKRTYWISSNNGLSHFDPKNETFTNYTTKDGLGSDDYNLEAYAKTKDGTLYFGGKNGVTYFNPKELENNTSFPSVRFTNIKIEDSVYNKIPSKLSLPYKGHITFEFAAINPDKTEKINYAYQLVGQDKNWYYINKNRYLEFTNLAPGNYELRVKSTNSNALWNTNYTSVSLHVPTPWYKTMYFKGVCVLLLILASYSFYHIKLSRVERRNKLLERKVEERTVVIKQKNRALNIEKNKTEEAYTQLKKLESFKNEFTGMLAHDLKNPLVTILGYSSDASENTNLKSINRSGKAMLTLIENMLEVQKFENAEVKLNTDRCNLKSIVSGAKDHIALLANEKRIQIKNEVEAFYNVNVDKNIVERIFINLLTNAIKFSESDKSIEISVKVANEKSKEITICVKDYGSGIPKNLLPIIFNKFSQIEAKDSGVSRSTGLGLSFCKMTVEAHGGKIWVKSELNIGTSFFFTLPRLENSIIEESQNKTQIIEEYKNPLYNLDFNAKDFDVLDSFSKKINALSIYELGDWLDLFEELETQETENIKTWKNMMMEALTNFDEKAFLHLKNSTVKGVVKP